MIYSHMNFSVTSSISWGNYYKPAFDADYEERTLFIYRDKLKAQIKSLADDDSPYKSKAEEIEKNLNTIISFVEKQIYENQILKEKQLENRQVKSERTLNPIVAASKEERRGFRLLLSMDGKLKELDRLVAASKSTKSTDLKCDLLRRAVEISIEINRHFG